MTVTFLAAFLSVFRAVSGLYLSIHKLDKFIRRHGITASTLTQPHASHIFRILQAKIGKRLLNFSELCFRN